MSFQLYLTALSHPFFAGIMTYFGQSNAAGKLIVILLFLSSLLAWTVMLGKFFELQKKKEQNLKSARFIHSNDALLELNAIDFRRDPSPFSRVFQEALAAYQNTRNRRHNTSIQVGLVENSLQRSIAKVSANYESRMVLLSSIVTGAPFMGLLGTVWGVMDAFGSIATSQSASIQALAPGVSGSLLTTVAGLLVAIPSVFGYNYLVSQVKTMIMELENFSSDLADRIELEIQERNHR